MRRWDQYPGIGDYDPPEYEEPYDEWLDGWYQFNDDRTDEEA